MTSILSHLDEEVATSGSETLFPGRIGWIIYAVNQGHYLPAASEVTGNTESSDTSAANTSSEQTTTSKTEVVSATSDSRALPKRERPSIGFASRWSRFVSRSRLCPVG